MITMVCCRAGKAREVEVVITTSITDFWHGLRIFDDIVLHLLTPGERISRTRTGLNDARLATTLELDETASRAFRNTFICSQNL